MTSYRVGGALALALALAAPVFASDETAVAPLGQRAWSHVTFGAVSAPAVPARLAIAFAAPAPADMPSASAQRPVAYTYSDGYETRKKIHKYASYATLPLFIAQAYAGQKLYTDGGSTAKSWHDALMAGSITLFTVNTVTGGWNLLESRKDPNGRTRRLVHSLMMFGADIGFVVTASLAPDDDDEGGGGSGSRANHRAAAFTSISLATASYLYMFFTR